MFTNWFDDFRNFQSQKIIGDALCSFWTCVTIANKNLPKFKKGKSITTFANFLISPSDDLTRTTYSNDSYALCSLLSYDSTNTLLVFNVSVQWQNSKFLQCFGFWFSSQAWGPQNGIIQIATQVSKALT